MPGVRGAFKQLREVVASCSTPCPINNLSLDDCTVTITFERPGSSSTTVNVVYTDGDAYPNCSVLVLCEQADDLSHLAEAFSDNAPLPNVVLKVCQHFQLASTFLDPLLAQQAKSSNPPATANGEDVDMDVHENGHHTGKSDVGDDSDDDNDDDDSNGGGNDDDDGDVYSDNDSNDNGVEDEEDAQDVEMQEDDDDERELLTYCEKKRSRWRQYEQALEEAEAEAAKNLSASQSQAAKLQIFNPQEAFSMLCKEMIDLIKENSHTLQLLADTVGDDVYHWNIELANFEPNSDLAEDLTKVQKLYGYSTVILRLRFTRGLHPFYPPSVEIVRPHFKPPILGAVAAHPMLQLPNWDPWRPQRELIEQIKSFLVQTARVDTSHPRNNILEYECAYSPVEQQLARVEALSGLPIMALDKYHSVYEAMSSYKRDAAHLEALLQRKKRGRTDGPKPPGGVDSTAATAPPIMRAGGVSASPQRYWAAGTGYGHVGTEAGPVWDSKGAEAAQKAQDDEKQCVVQLLCSSLASALQLRDDAKRRGGRQEDAVACPASSSAPTLNETEECVKQVEESCLIPFLVTELGLPSFTDMITRAYYYTTLFKLVRELCRPPSARLLTLPYNNKTVAEVATTYVESAKKFLSVMQKYQSSTDAGDVATAPNTKKAKTASESALSSALMPHFASGSAPPHPLPAAQPAANQLTPEEVQGATLAEVIVDVERRISQQGCSSSGATQSLSPYLAALKPLQLEYLESFESGHEYLRKISGEAVQPKERVIRLAKEIAGLNSLLPLTESSSIHVRIMESNISLWKVLIIGPEDSPYSGACFVFDLYFPPTYPKLAPMVLLKTTGGGTVRFNPNLYNCGKVCLSLLGTWSGARGETWNPDHSTALQILISIQSLILVPDPYFNEPGFEKGINTDQGSRQSRDYNKVIREASVHRAMIDQLKKPPPEFKSVIETHFALRGDYILRTLNQWVEEGRTYDHTHADTLVKLRGELEGLINKAKKKCGVS